METPKKEEKEGVKNQVILEISNLEKGIDKIKSNISSLLEKNKEKELENIKSKEIIDDIIKTYKNKLKDKEKEYDEERKTIKDLIAEYDKILENKDLEIKNLKNSKDETLILKELKENSIPQELINLNRIELAIKLTEILKENHLLSKKIESFKTEKQDLMISKEAFLKKISELNAKNSENESINSESKNEIRTLLDEKEILKKQLLETNKLYEERVLLLRRQYEERINQNISESAKEKVISDTTIKVLTRQINEFQQKLNESQNKREEIALIIENRLKESLTPLIAKAMINHEEEQDTIRSIETIKKIRK